MVWTILVAIGKKTNKVITETFRRVGILILSLFILGIFNNPTHAQEYYDGMLDPTYSNGSLKGFNGYVYDTAIQDDGKILVSGWFDQYNGIERTNILRLNSDGSLDTSFEVGTGAKGGWGANRILLQDDGKIVILGSFTEYNGVSRNGIARLNSDGSLDTSFDPGTGFSGMVDDWGNNYGVLDAVLQDDGKIVAAGSFTGYNGSTRGNIARINPDGSLDTTFVTEVGTGSSLKLIWELEILTNQKLLIAGDFTTYEGSTARYFVRLNTDGTLDSTFNVGSGPNSVVEGIYVKDNGEIYIAGNFSSYNGTSRNNMALLNSDGTINSSFVPKAFIKTYSGWGPKNLTVQDDGKILVGGWFDGYDGVTADGIVRINPDGTRDTTFNVPTNGRDNRVEKIRVLESGEILLNGYFTQYNGTYTNYLAKLESDGSLDTTFNDDKEQLGASSSVNVIKKDSQNRTVIAGNFSYYDGEPQNRIARINENGTLDTSFDIGTGFDNTVYDLEVLSGGEIIVAGYMTEYNGTSIKKLALLNSDGSLDETFNSGGSGVGGTYPLIYDIEVQDDGKILIGGMRFTSYNDTSVGYIARLNSDGTLDTSFSPIVGADNEIRTIEVQSNGKILIGGNFKFYDNVERNKIARLNTDGTLDSTFDPSLYLPTPESFPEGTYDCTFTINMWDVWSDGWDGAQLSTLIDGTNSNTYTCSGGETTEVFTINNGQSIEFTYTAGSYENEHSYEILMNDIPIYETEPPPATGTVYTYTCGESFYTTPSPNGFNNYVYDIEVLENGNILIGGSFTTYNGIEHNRIILLSSTGESIPDFNSESGFNGNVNVIRKHPDGKILIGGGFTEYDGQDAKFLVRINQNGTLDTTLNSQTSFNNSILDIVIENTGKLLVGGYFTKYGSTETPYITRLLNDLEAPSGSITINNDKKYTSSRNVNLSLTNLDNMSGVSEMMLCNNNFFDNCTWVNYSSTKSWTLTSGEGTKTVFVKFKDGAGNISSVYSDSIILRTPTVRITDIGSISNVLDKDSLKYYFTSTTPVIKGTTQANSTVTFKYDEETYNTQADSGGNYTISLRVSRGTNDIEYYSTDVSDNKSTTRELTLIVGTENFPEWLLERLGLILNKEEKDNEENEDTNEEEEEETTEDEQQEDEDTYTPPVSNKRKIKFTDKKGNPLAQATVEIDGNTYVTNSEGEIEVDNLDNRTYSAKVKTKDGKEYSMDILGGGDENGSIVVEVDDDTGINWKNIIIYSGIGLVILVVILIIFTKKKRP